jgi:hypothetical protein
VLGICDFRHKTPRQSQISLTWPKGSGFSGQNKFIPLSAKEKRIARKILKLISD